MASVEIDELYLSLGGNPVLNGVSLQLGQGECLALLGPSGCGKTTTLRAIAGFVRADRGQVRFGGIPVDDRPAHRRNVGLVFQDYALFPHMTVEENVGYGLRMRSVARSQIQRSVGEALERVRLSGFERRLPSELSGGQRQRVALARAIVIEPDILLLDEPLGALDRKLRDGMQIELKRLQRDLGITTLIVTHDQEEALSLSNRVAVMFSGRIAAVDTPESLYRRPPRADVMAFLGRANFIPVRTIEGSSNNEVMTPFGLRLRAHCAGPRARAQPGASAKIGIRPEHLLVRKGLPEPLRGEFSASVVDLIYRGALAEVLLQAHPEGSGAPAVLLSADLPSEGLAIRRGDAVAVRLPEDYCLIFEENDS